MQLEGYGNKTYLLEDNTASKIIGHLYHTDVTNFQKEATWDNTTEIVDYCHKHNVHLDSYNNLKQPISDSLVRLKTLYKGYGNHNDMGNFYESYALEDNKELGIKKGHKYLEQVGDVGMPGREHYLLPANKEFVNFLVNIDSYQVNPEFKQIMTNATRNWPQKGETNTIELPQLTIDSLEKLDCLSIPNALPNMPWKTNRIQRTNTIHPHKTHER